MRSCTPVWPTEADGNPSGEAFDLDPRCCADNAPRTSVPNDGELRDDCAPERHLGIGRYPALPGALHRDYGTSISDTARWACWALAQLGRRVPMTGIRRVWPWECFPVATHDHPPYYANGDRHGGPADLLQS